MAVAPSSFFKFLAEHAELTMALFDRGEIDEAGLMAMIERHSQPAHPAVDHVRRQLEELGILERTPHAEQVFELAAPMQDLLRWLTHRQRLSGAVVLRAYFDSLGSAGAELDRSVLGNDPGAAALALKEADGLVDRVRGLTEGNRESTVSEAQILRSAGPALGAVERYVEVRRLWEHHLEPLVQLVKVDGPMEAALDRLRAALEEGERRFFGHRAVHRALGRTLSRLARMRRGALDDHLAAVKEVAPLYERYRRESRWAIGASVALRRIRAEGAGSLGLDARLGLTGLRPRHLLADDKLRARLSALVGYVPGAPVTLGQSPPPPDLPLVPREVLKARLTAAAPLDDVLAFVLREWPTMPLRAQLRAFGHVACGTFGATSIGAAARTYDVPAGRIRAWPLVLPAVVS